MNLVIDIGNTRTKVAVFENKHIQHYFVFNSIDELIQNSELKNIILQIKKIIISNVSNIELTNYLSRIIPSVPIYYLSKKLPLFFDIDYESDTIGSDRIAAASGVIAEFSSATVLNIDFGTCIKYNVIHQKTFCGGAISPGLKMRYKSLQHFTGKLPNLENSIPSELPAIIGKNTNDNLHSGVILGCVSEINYFISEVSKRYSDNIKIVIAGGDANFFEKLLERKVFLRPYLILNGLNEILEYQK